MTTVSVQAQSQLDELGEAMMSPLLQVGPFAMGAAHVGQSWAKQIILNALRFERERWPLCRRCESLHRGGHTASESRCTQGCGQFAVCMQILNPKLGTLQVAAALLSSKVAAVTPG